MSTHPTRPRSPMGVHPHPDLELRLHRHAFALALTCAVLALVVVLQVVTYVGLRREADTITTNRESIAAVQRSVDDAVAAGAQTGKVTRAVQRVQCTTILELARHAGVDVDGIAAALNAGPDPCATKGNP